MHFWDPSQWDTMCLEFQRIKFQWKNGSKFSHLLTIRAEGADRTISVFFTTSLLRSTIKLEGLSLQVFWIILLVLHERVLEISFTCMSGSSIFKDNFAFNWASRQVLEVLQLIDGLVSSSFQGRLAHFTSGYTLFTRPNEGIIKTMTNFISCDQREWKHKIRGPLT